MTSSNKTLLKALRHIIMADTLLANFKTVEKKFEQQGIDKETIKQYLADFKKLRDTKDLGENKDIDTWGKKSWNEFKKFVDNTKKEKSKTEEKKIKKVEGADLVFSDKNWSIYKILNFDAAMNYGSGTKWCITNRKHWVNYTQEQESCFYFLISKINSDRYVGEKNDPFHKIAVEVTESGEITYWDASDTQYSAKEIPNFLKLPDFDYSWFKVEKPAPSNIDINTIINKIKAGEIDRKLGDMISQICDEEEEEVREEIQGLTSFFKKNPKIYGKYINFAEKYGTGCYENNIDIEITKEMLQEVSDEYLINSILYASVYGRKRITKDAIDYAFNRFKNPLKEYGVHDTYMTLDLASMLFSFDPKYKTKIKTWLKELPTRDELKENIDRFEFDDDIVSYVLNL